MKLLKIVAVAVALTPVCSLADGFNGFYLGATAGGVFAKEKGTGYDVTSGTESWSHQTEPGGAVLGLKGGYSKLLPNKVLLGIEAGYENRSSNRDGAYQTLNGVIDPTVRKTTKLLAASVVQARIGYAFNPQTVAYVSAGYSRVKVNGRYEDVGLNSESHGYWQNGWTTGLGLEYLLSKNISAGLEYRYADYGKKNVDVSNLWSEYYKERLTEQGLRVGITYRF